MFAILLSAAFPIKTFAAEPSPRLHIVAGSELDYAPYALVTEDGRPDGFSVDLLKAVCDAMDIDVSFRVGPWNEIRRALEKGELDMLPLVSYSKERDRVLDFSMTHTVANGVIFKRAGSPDIKQTSDLRGKPIIVMRADAAHDWLVRNDITNDLLLADTVADSLQFLTDGLQEYALAPRLVGLLTAKELGLDTIETTGPLIDAYGRGYGFAVKSGNFTLLKKLNEGLSIVRATGQYDAIYQKWFGSVDPKGVPVAIILRYGAISAGGVTVLSVLVLVWIIALRRTVRRQTKTLRTAYTEIEHKVAERTRELQAEAGQRRQTERKLRKSEARFLSLAKAAPMVIVIRDLDGRIQWANEEMSRRTGMSLDEMVGKTSHDIHAPEVADEIARLDQKALESHEPQLVELTVRSQRGESWPELNVRFPIEDGEGNVVGLGAVALDMTKQRAIELQLRQAQKLQVVGQLTGGIAHDFNNLLQVIQTNLELAMPTVIDRPTVTKLIEGALRAGRRGASLTEKLLAFSRRQTLRPAPLDLKGWIRTELSLLSRTLGEDVQIETRIEDSSVIVVVDEGALTNALLNIAINARAAMPKGGRLVITVRRQHLERETPIENDMLPKGDYVEIAVSDTGCGMSEEVLRQAFEPFFTTKDVGEGSGLGLSMVYGFARQSGGMVSIESELDRGTTVRILLPVADERPQLADSPPPERQERIHTLKVLLVEDDQDVRESTVAVLQSLGCEVIEAEHAGPVPGLLCQHDDIDILISDVVLPGGRNGVELVEDALDLRPDLKVILVSGYPEGTLEKSGLTETRFPLLGKPFTTAELSEALARVMAGGKRLGPNAHEIRATD